MFSTVYSMDKQGTKLIDIMFNTEWAGAYFAMLQRHAL